MNCPTRRRVRFSLRTLFALIVAVGLGLLLMIPAAHLPIYYSHARKGREHIDSIGRRISPALSPGERDVVDFWMGCAYGNVCFSPDHVSLAELKRLNEDVRLKLETNVDLDTADWIWRRLAETGPHGAQYVAKFEPRYRQELANARRRKTSVPLPTPKP